jgi:hypothetical protein
MRTLPLFKAIIGSEERYFLINGRFTSLPSDLDIDIGTFSESSFQGSSVSSGKYFYQPRIERGSDRNKFWLSVLIVRAPADDTATMRYLFVTVKFYCGAYSKGLNFWKKAFGQKPTACPPVLAARSPLR